MRTSPPKEALQTLLVCSSSSKPCGFFKERVALPDAVRGSAREAGFAGVEDVLHLAVQAGELEARSAPEKAQAEGKGQVCPQQVSGSQAQGEARRATPMIELQAQRLAQPQPVGDAQGDAGVDASQVSAGQGIEEIAALFLLQGNEDVGESSLKVDAQLAGYRPPPSASTCGA